VLQLVANSKQKKGITREVSFKNILLLTVPKPALTVDKADVMIKANGGTLSNDSVVLIPASKA
jgi:hypothetical protein